VGRVNRIGIGVALLVVVGVGIAFAVGGSVAPTTAPPAPRSGLEAAVVASGPSPSPSPSPAPASRDEVAPAPAPADALRVRVQDRTRRPIAGATIEVSGDDADLTFPPTGADGWTSSGRLPRADVSLLARGDGRSGSAHWRWSAALTTEVTIWTNRDRDVEVTVVDPIGAPHVAATVGLFGDLETQWRHPSATGTTDDDGVARLHVGGETWLAAHAGMRAVATVGGALVVAEPVAWAEDGPTRVTITAERPAPPSGPRLRVRFVDDSAAVVAVRGTLAWSRIVAAGSGTYEAPAGELEVDGEEVTVAGLLDGDHLRLQLHEEGRLVPELEVTLPPGAREDVAVLVRGRSAPRLVIPLVDTGRRPVAAGAFVVTVLLHGGGYEREATLRPDAEGRLVVTLAESRSGTIEIAEPYDAARLHWPVPPRLQRPYRTTHGGEPPPNPPLAVLEFPLPEPGATIELGPVTVADVAPRLHGVVRDANGAPVAGVGILLSTVTRPEPEAFAAFATRSDADGRFAIHATALPDEVFVAGRLPLGFCAPVRVRPSAEPVTLRLQPTGALALDLRAPERPALPEALRQQLRARIDLRIDDDALVGGAWMLFRQRSPVFEAGWRDRWGACQWLPEAGECRFRDLVPGTYRVLADVAGNRVLDVPGVQVTAGETARPPALQDAVVGAGVEANCVRLRDREGRPLAGVRVWLQLPEWKPQHPHGEWCDTDANGEAWYVVPRGALAGVDVKAPGFAPVARRGVTLPVEVTMGPGTSFDFAITGLDAVVRDARAIVVGCLPYDGTPPTSPVRDAGGARMFGHPRADLDADGRATIPNLAPGRYRLWLGVVPPLQSPRGHTFVLLGDRLVTSGDAAHVPVAHRVTAEEAAILLAR
jgi:hypothetical protein